MCMYMYMLWPALQGHRRVGWSQFFASTGWIMGIELRLSGLAAILFAHGTISLVFEYF